MSSSPRFRGGWAMISVVLTLGPSLRLKVRFHAILRLIDSANRVAVGLVESLWRETSPLGLQTLLIEPGRFRTKLLSGSNRKTRVSAIKEYAELSDSKTAGLNGEDMNQPGDPVKLVEIILDLVRKEGVAQGKQVPLRIPLGVDVFDDMKAKCEETLALLEDWKDVIQSTDFPA